MVRLGCCARPRLVRVGEFSGVHLNLIDNRCDLFFPTAVVGAVCVFRVGGLLPRTGGKEEWLEGGYAAANDTHVCFNSGPYPDLITFPRRIIGAEKCVMDPIGSERAGDHYYTADREEDDKTDALTPWQ